jgi:hypothetical protein
MSTPRLTTLQREILAVLTDEPQGAYAIERARRAQGLKPMSWQGVRMSAENLAVKGLAKRSFYGAPMFAAVKES